MQINLTVGPTPTKAKFVAKLMRDNNNFENFGPHWWIYEDVWELTKASWQPSKSFIPWKIKKDLDPIGPILFLSASDISNCPI